MGFRFSRRINLFPGLTLNLSGSGDFISTDFGVQIFRADPQSIKTVSGAKVVFHQRRRCVFYMANLALSLGGGAVSCPAPIDMRQMSHRRSR